MLNIQGKINLNIKTILKSIESEFISVLFGFSYGQGVNPYNSHGKQ